jgi:hypothetical protein
MGEALCGSPDILDVGAVAECSASIRAPKMEMLYEDHSMCHVGSPPSAGLFGTRRRFAKPIER